MTNDLLRIKVHVHEDSEDVTFEWDETHPTSIELKLDEWTEEEWLAALDRGMAETIEDEG